jgi:hypothetical protein
MAFRGLRHPHALQGRSGFGFGDKLKTRHKQKLLDSQLNFTFEALLGRYRFFELQTTAPLEATFGTAQ